MCDTCIPCIDSHEDLGLILSEDLSWDKHYKIITAHAYKVMRLIQCTILPSHSLYVSLVQSQLLYCTQIRMASTLDERYIDYRTSPTLCH